MHENEPDYVLTKKKILEVYTELAPSYDHIRETEYNTDNKDQLEMLAQLLPAKASILDAGCGTGNPVLKFFSELGHDVVGSDVTPGQLEFVKIHAPNAKTLCCDTAELNLPDETFDLVTSFYSMMHMNVERQTKSFEIFHKILKKGGYLFITLMSEAHTGSPEFSGLKNYEGYGFPIFHTTPDNYKNILETIGFTTIDLSHKVTMFNFGSNNLLWYLGKKT